MITDTERLDFVYDRRVTMYKDHPSYKPFCICFDLKDRQRETIIANTFREALDKAISMSKI